MTGNLTAERKAELISIGTVTVDKDLKLPEYIARSTAGPGAGGQSVFFAADNRRVRLSIRDESRLHMKTDGDQVILEKDGIGIARGVIESAPAHCPRQAYITVSERCCFHCAFCPVHSLQGPVKSKQEITALIDQVLVTGDLHAISLTSGVEISPEAECARMAGLVRELRPEYRVPVGVSVYPTPDSSDVLHEAGAVEVKYNLETTDPEIFARVCPELNQDEIREALSGAVDIFGPDHVSSNIIIGLGETDGNVLSGAEDLAVLGVIPNFRPVVLSPRVSLPGAVRPSAERLVTLGLALKDILSDYGLDPRNARTMCLPCTGCDIVPFRDL